MNIKVPATVLITGRPNQGKSHFIKYLFATNNFKYGLVFTRTKFNGGFDYIDQRFVHNTYKKEKIEQLMAIQASIKSKGLNPPNAFIVFDDALETSKWSSEFFTNLISQYRHFNISIIISSQYVKRIPTTSREVCRHSVMFSSSSEVSIKGLYESFGQQFDTYNEWKQFFMENTPRFQFICINLDTNKIVVSKVPKKITVKNLAHIDLTQRL